MDTIDYYNNKDTNVYTGYIQTIELSRRSSRLEFLFVSALESLERICLRTKTYIVLLPWRSWRRSLQLFPAFAFACPTLVRCRMLADAPVVTGPGPGLGVRDADGSPRRESRTSSRVVEPGLGLFRRRAAVAIASSVSLWPDPNRFHAGVKKETETSASSSSWPRTFVSLG